MSETIKLENNRVVVSNAVDLQKFIEEKSYQLSVITGDIQRLQGEANVIISKLESILPKE